MDWEPVLVKRIFLNDGLIGYKLEQCSANSLPTLLSANVQVYVQIHL